jgi:drug/metabolite transporter (DMT)-like permease
MGVTQAAPERLVGDLLLLGTGVAWAFYNFATQGVVQSIPPSP